LKILDYLKEDRVNAELQGKDKLAVLKELSGMVAGPCRGGSEDEIVRVLLDREGLESTGIGEGIAIPHGRLKRLKNFVVSFGRSVQGVEFDSIDHKPSHLFFLVMAPENSAVDNLKLLSRIVTLLKDASFKRRLMEGRSQKELFQIISDEDAKY